jgi:hypothetical protein
MTGDATPWVYHTGAQKPDFPHCRSGDIQDLQPLYASPVVPVGSGEPVARATCQDCGGHIEGWICQSCDREFREDDAGNLVFEGQPVVPVGVSREETILFLTLKDLIREQSEGEWDEKTIENDARIFTARIIASLRPTDTGANHD